MGIKNIFQYSCQRNVFAFGLKIAKYCHYGPHLKHKDLPPSPCERANILYPDTGHLEPLKWAQNEEIAFLSEQMSTSVKLLKPCGNRLNILSQLELLN